MKGIFGGDVILTLKAPLVNTETGLEITKVFSCSTQLSLKFKLLINIKILIKKVGWLVGFVALRPKSTAMVIAGRSVHLTTLFPGQA